MTRRASIKRSRWVIVVLLLFSFAWRIHNLDAQSLWRDEIDAIYFALRDLPTALSMFVDTGQNGALYFLALRPWLRLMGTTEFALRYPSVLFGILAIPLLWQVGRKLIPKNFARNQNEHSQPAGRRFGPSKYTSLWQATVGDVAVMAAVFLAINPYHLWYSQDGKMYALITLLALLAVWFWLQGIDRGGWKPWFGFLLTVSIAIYTHLLMILLIPLFFIWFLIAWPQSKYHWQGYLIALAGLTLPYLPLLWWQWDFLTASEQLTSLTFIPLTDILRTVLLYQSNSFLQPQNLLYLVPLLILALIGVVLGSKAIHQSPGSPLHRLTAGRRHLLIVAWLVVPVLSIYILSTRQPVFLPRYIIWITPATLLFMALGLELLWRGHGKLSQPLALALILYVVVYWVTIGWGEKTTTIKADLRNAVTNISERRQPDELIIFQIPHMQYAYAYYTSDQDTHPFDQSDERLGWWDVGLSVAPELSDEAARIQVEQQMQRKIFGATDIWVLLSEEELFDQRYLMVEWLNNNMTLIQQEDFHEAQIRHYRLE